MDTSRHASGYDLFKLVVAIILLILFILLASRPNTRPVPLTDTSTAVHLTETMPFTPSVTLNPNPVAALATSTFTLEGSTPLPSRSPTGTIEPAQTTSFPSPTDTQPGSPTATPLPSPIATSPDAPTATALPAPTSTPVIKPAPTSTAATPSTRAACDAAASRSRLQPGMHATILRRLNFRSSPGIRDNWLRTNIPGTQVEIVGGPECIPHHAGAYLWWQVRLPDGEIGWSAEGSIHGTFYFMEP